MDMNPDYCFENFGVGPSNRFAHAAALSVTDGPGKTFNSLFIYGKVGSGKTHLLNAVGNRLRSHYPQLNVVYVSAHDFMTELTHALIDERIEEFRAQYRSVDCLLIDDIDLISEKEEVQEEFLSALNILCDTGRQVVAACERNPAAFFHSVGRFHLGSENSLLADIKPLDFETKSAILEKKASANGITLTSDAACFIALNASSVKAIEDILVQVLTYSLLTKREIDLFLVTEIFMKTWTD